MSDDLVKRLRRFANDLGSELIDEAAAALVAKDAEIARLRWALEPLAVMADRYDPEDGDGDLECWSGLAVPKIKHIRAARAALNTQHKGETP